MKNITFEMQKNVLCVRADGVLLYKPRLDVVVIKKAVKAHAVSPQMKTFMFATITRELKDEGFQPNEIKIVVKRFEEEFVV